MFNEYLDDEHKIPMLNTMARGRKRRIRPERMTANESARIVTRIAALYSRPSTIGVQYAGPGTRAAGTSDRAEQGINECIDSLNPPEDAPILEDRYNMVALGRCARPQHGGRAAPSGTDTRYHGIHPMLPKL